jgi:hypothetical protein
LLLDFLRSRLCFVLLLLLPSMLKLALQRASVNWGL